MSESVGHTLKPTGQAYRWTPSCLPSLKIYGFTVQMPWRLGFEGKDVELIHHFVSMGFRPQNTEGMCLKLFEYLKHCETQKWCIVNGFHCPVCLCSTFFVRPVLPATCLAACRKGIVAEGPGCCLLSSSNVNCRRQCKSLSQRQAIDVQRKCFTMTHKSIVGRTQALCLDGIFCSTWRPKVSTTAETRLRRQRCEGKPISTF